MSSDDAHPLEVLSFEPAHQLMDSLVVGNQRGLAVEYLKNYFETEPYTGRWFDRLDDGGDRPEVAGRITASDLVALSLLGVAIRRGDVVIDLLYRRAAELSERLEVIPTDVAMHEVPWASFGPGSAADEAYWLLRQCRGVGRTVANKLLARKRPQLLPVYDEQVHHLLGQPPSAWSLLWSWFHICQVRDEGLAAFDEEVAGIKDISLLRRLDVVLWMAATSGGH